MMIHRMNPAIVESFHEFMGVGVKLFKTALALKSQRQSGSCYERAAQEKESKHDRPIGLRVMREAG